MATREQQRQALVGKKINRLTCIKYTYSDKKQGPCYKFKCDCGKVIETRGSSVVHGNTRSCGCLQVEWCETGNARSKTGEGHGMKDTHVYQCWEDMMQRTTNPNSKAFHKYGGAGLGVCDDWKIFQNFYRDMGDPTTKKHTLDRIEGTNGYSKDNCRWATRMEQSHNIKTNVNITYKGETHCVSEWARRIGVSNDALHYRLKNWNIDDAMTLKAGEKIGNQYGSRLTFGEQK